MHNGQIVFSEKFDARSDADQIDYLKKLCSSQNEALDAMQKERNALAEKLSVSEQQLRNAEAAFRAQKEIVTNIVTKSNEDVQQSAQRIQELESRVKAQDTVIESYHGRQH